MTFNLYKKAAQNQARIYFSENTQILSFVLFFLTWIEFPKASVCSDRQMSRLPKGLDRHELHDC